MIFHIEHDMRLTQPPMLIVTELSSSSIFHLPRNQSYLCINVNLIKFLKLKGRIDASACSHVELADYLVNASFTASYCKSID